MKSLFKITVLSLLMIAKISYAQVKTPLTSSSIELNATFVPSSTIASKDAPIFKDINLNTFYEIKKSIPTSTKLFYSLDQTEKNGKIFILKTVYDTDKNVNSLSVSCNDASLIKSKIQSTPVSEKVYKECNRYHYTLSGCWLAIIDYIFN
jgi:hypothetical protein